MTYSLATSIELTNFVGLAIYRDREKKSLVISQPHFVGKIMELYSVPTIKAKYPMVEDFLTSLKTSTNLLLLSSELQTLYQEKVENIL